MIKIGDRLPAASLQEFIEVEGDGCALGPKYERPAAELPAAWQQAPAQGAPAIGARWWTLYQDPVLDRLIDEALAHNQDLALAAARVDEARALARVADSEFFPAIDGGFQRDRTRSSSRSSTPLPPSVPPCSTTVAADAMEPSTRSMPALMVVVPV